MLNVELHWIILMIESFIELITQLSLEDNREFLELKIISKMTGAIKVDDGIKINVGKHCKFLENTFWLVQVTTNKV